MQRLSVVIANHDYQHFVGRAVNSALALDWDDLEVVVVDDGSNDGSVEVLRGFGDRITLHLQANLGQRVAANVGFAISTGDVVVFLDSDDVLPRDLPRHLHAAMGPGVSKVQLQAQRIDEHGVEIGHPFPAFRPVPSPEMIRRWASRTTAYPTPPGSANAYARWFLDRVMPVADTGDQAADSALLAAAPLLGSVVTVPGVLVGYRRHGENDSRLLADPARFVREIQRAGSRWRFARLAAGLPPEESALRRSRELLQLRAAAVRLSPASHPVGERTARLLLDAVRSPLHPGPEPVWHRVMITVWTIAVLLAPVAASRRLIELRYGRAR